MAYFDTTAYVEDNKEEVTITYELNGNVVYITKAEYIDDNYDLVEFNLSDQEEHKIISKIQETLEENPYETYDYWKEAL
jgi:PHD/YefM family antitoxin component YafN of YafNO toxin-antitoxin module